MAAQPTNVPDLWQRAISSLPPATIAYLDPAKTGKRDVALAALKAAEEKRNLSLKKQWRIKRSSGHGDIIVRDVLEKIVFWIRRFKEVGDQFVQYDPGHASLPWAAFRFLLQAAVNSVEVYAGMIEDLEMVARLMARLCEVEKLYLTTLSALDDQLGGALVSVYAAILAFLAKAMKFFNDPVMTRALKDPFRCVDEDSRGAILAREAEVFKLTALVDAARLVNVELQVLRLADISITAQKHVEEGRYLEVMSWLSDVPYREHHRSTCDLRLPGTGTWLSQHPIFRSWEAVSSCSSLLVHGIPGCGKTLLCSAVIDKYLADKTHTPNTAPLAYFYCNTSESERDRRSAEGVLRSLTRQLTASLSPQPIVHSAVLALYDNMSKVAKADGFEPGKAKIPECVEMILATLDDNPATLIIDALDEIDNPKRLVDAIETIISKSRNVVKVLITSRNDPAIFAMLPFAQTVRVTKEQNGADVRSFTSQGVEDAISAYRLLTGNVTGVLKKRLVDELTSSAGEMFLWAKLQLAHLCSLKHENDLLESLITLAPSSLEELYQAAYGRIERAGKASLEIAMCSFTWLLYAQEPLTVDTFISAVVAATGLQLPTVGAILDICHGFMILDEGSKVFRFAHKSVQDFLRLKEAFQPGHAHGRLTIWSLSSCRSFPEDVVTELQPNERLYDYAALYWGHHCSAALSADKPLDISGHVHSFLYDENEPSIYAMMWMDNVRASFTALPRNHLQKGALELVSSRQYSFAFVACALGVLSILESREWKADYDWDERNDHGQTCLYAASVFNHTKIVRFLLDRGADSDIECGRLGSALHCAAYQGHSAIVKLLLEHGTQTNRGSKFDNAVHAACRGDHEHTVQVILDSCAKITDQTDYDSIAEAVCEAGFSEAMEKLHGHPQGVATKPTRNMKMIKKAICSGQVSVLKHLTRNPNSTVPTGAVALSAFHGHEAMTEYLIDQGLDIAEPGDFGSPLRCASLQGHTSICRLLLHHGVNVNGTDRFGSALHAAAMKGQFHTVKLLLDAGAYVNGLGGYYGTSLQAAAYQGHREIVSLLVSQGAYLHLSGFSKDVFHAAAEGGQHQIIQLLLNLGFTPSEPINYGMRHSRRSQPPPRNILRDSSPGRSQRMYRHRSFRAGDGAEEAQLIDPSNPTPHARAHQRIRMGYLPWEGENYALNAAAANGHLEALRVILAASNVLELDTDAMNEALVTTCKNGHQSSAEELLGRMAGSKVPSRAFEVAASMAVVRVLLDHKGAAGSPGDHLEAILLTSAEKTQEVFHETLAIAENELLPIDVKEFLLDCLPSAVRNERVDMIRTILARSEAADHQKIINILKESCKDGSGVVARSMCEGLPLHALSSGDLLQCIRLAAENSRVDVVRYFVPLLKESAKAECLHPSLLAAAGSGDLDVLETLLNISGDHDEEMLQQALNLAAEKGHEAVCAHLLADGVDPCKSAKSSAIAVKSQVERISPPRGLYFLIEYWEEANATGTKEGGKADLANVSLLDSKIRRLNAIECCISSFQRFNRGSEDYHVTGSPEVQTSTLLLLLENVHSLRNEAWDEAFCAAVELCPPSLVACMLQKGANPMARHGGRSAVNFAVGRECLCFPLLQLLVVQGAHDEVPQDELRRQLRRAVSFFHVQKDYPLLSGTKSLEDVFTTGPGAAVEYLLRRLPEETTNSAEYSVMLQCAAAAGNTNIVTLLLDRRTEVNDLGSYYGTALQAASRFARMKVVKQLLEAGADPNIREGRHYTALRAAVLGQSLEAVNLLLSAGANTELSKQGDSKLESTPLQLAIEDKLVEIAQSLILAGARIEVSPTRPLVIQACEIGNLPLICAFLGAGADVQSLGSIYEPSRYAGRAGRSGMHAAIDAGHADVIVLLLSKGFRLYAETAEMNAPLTFAAYKGEASLVKILLESGQPMPGCVVLEALKAATQMSHFEVVEMLLHYRPGVLSEEHGFTLLSTACESADTEIAELLLETLSNNGGLQVSCEAVLETPPEAGSRVFELILEYVACTVDFFVEACARGYDGVVKTGLQQRLPTSTIDSKGRPAFHFAVISGSTTIVESLLSQGADPNAQHPTYGTPLRAALEAYAIHHLNERQLPEDAQAHARLLTRTRPGDGTPSSMRRLRVLSPPKPQQYENVIQLLLESGASPNPPLGVFGSSLTLAACTGSRKVFHALLERHAKHDVGGYLHSPLEAACTGGHTSLAAEILKQSLHNTSSNIEEQGGDTHILDVMLSRNSQLKITEDMLLAVHYASDLRVLLDHADTKDGLVTDKVTADLVKKQKEYTSRKESGKMLEHLIAFDETILGLPAIAELLISHKGLDGLKRIWNHNPSLTISEDAVVRLVSNSITPGWEGREYPHDDLVELLRHYRDQWGFTGKVRHAIERRFPNSSDEKLKNLYLSLEDDEWWD